MTMLAWQSSGMETFAAPELNVPMYATVRLSAIAFFAFSDSWAASHDCFAAVASSRASNSMVVVPIFRLISSRAMLMALTIWTVCVREAPVIGRLDQILTVFAAGAADADPEAEGDGAATPPQALATTATPTRRTARRCASFMRDPSCTAFDDLRWASRIVCLPLIASRGPCRLAAKAVDALRVAEYSGWARLRVNHR